MNNNIVDHKGIFKRNIIAIYLFVFFRGFVFFFPIFTLYLQKELFSLTNVAIIISIQFFGRIIFEIPSGSIADLFGRKRTLIVSGILLIIGVIFLGIGSYFWILALAAILFSVSESLISNTDTALLYDSMKNARSSFGFKKIITWVTGFWQLGAAIGSLIGGFIAAYSFKFAIFYSIIPLIISVICLFFVTEPKYRKNRTSVFGQMRDAFSTISKDRILILILIISALTFSFTEIAWQLKPILFDVKQIPIVFFGVISSFLFILAFFGSFLTSYVLHKKHSDKALVIISAIISGILLYAAAISNGFMVPVFIALGSFSFGIRYTILNDMVNKKAVSANRATMLSILSLTSMAGVAIFSPIIGIIADAIGIVNTFILLAVLSLTALIPMALLKEK